MRRIAALAVAATLLSSAASLRPSGSVLGADYVMATVARYAVDQAAGQLLVSVQVAFSNTTPNPPSQLSGFDHVDLAVHVGATALAASDADGRLAVRLIQQDGVTVASVTTRSRVGSGEAADLTLSYRVPDGAPDVHVRPQVVQFPAWGFGTSSSVTIDLPSGLAAQVNGPALTIGSDDGGTHLTSGPIDDPATWVAYVTATVPITYTNASRTVALGSGTVELQVRSWTSDPAWGPATLDLLASGLPLLEKGVGLPYPRLGPLVVVETVAAPGAAGEPLTATAEIQADYSASPFTLLHQLAHVWAGDSLASDRWIREGLASHLAAAAAAQLGEALPYDPAARSSALAADAIPLETWTSSAADDRAREAYGYAASWNAVDQIAAAVGEEGLRQALARIEAGISAYDPATASQPAAPASHPPVDSRRLLDQLAVVSGLDLADLFASTVFPPETAAELEARAAARRALAPLDAAAGDWGRPLPVQEAMAEWRFDDADAAIAEATAWLVPRDGLQAAITRAGLTTPDRLAERWQSDGGGPGARTELAAESAVVTAYQAALDRAAGDRSILERIGLLGGDDPRAVLHEAAEHFEAGDLQAATDAISRAESRMESASLDGMVRSATLLLVGAVMVVLTLRPRRRRRPTDYTAAP
ncbi:MAG: hypothetical protein E6J47_02630 [Chloroflexi bacterium]|nr:MAG: hypothetical protein E6J47_02630 [Chloroflexota bacterium]